MGNVRDNKFLKVNPSVILTPVIEPVIAALESCFEAEGLVAVVTSGLRTPEDQLIVIQNFLRMKRLDVNYPEAMSGKIDTRFTWEGQEVYSWQPGWSALLNSGIIVNPPIAAICLLNYINAAGINRKGQSIPASNHIPGHAFDIGGGKNGLNDEVAVVLKYKDKIPGIVDYVIERNNNCLHLNCKIV